ncbi:MAG TPA: glycosyltransferase [Candidatus Omnitrophota bacterium]|nr:glycosyltransferase [Candidatus Omnitrophota bacterium]
MMKVALVHDWTIHMRGGEKVLDALAEIFPEATLYTLFSDPKRLSPRLRRLRIRNSFLQYLPGIRCYYRWLLPILPLAIRSLKLDSADVVISSSHCVAKGICKPAGAIHICYCHTPARYLWGFEGVYFDRYPGLIRRLIGLLLQWLRAWDLSVNKDVDLFIANSDCVKERIRHFYKRDALVVHPPVETRFYTPSAVREDYYLAVSHFVPYKRLDLVIEVFNRLDRKLLIAGSGPMERAYRAMKKSERIFFLGAVTDEELRALYAGARALIFPAEEDFGIVPVEAQSCGTPVIAFGRGGSLETVKTGVFFDEQTADSLEDAILRFEVLEPDPALTRERVESFGRNEFLDKIRQIVHSRHLHTRKSL